MNAETAALRSQLARTEASLKRARQKCAEETVAVIQERANIDVIVREAREVGALQVSELQQSLVQQDLDRENTGLDWIKHDEQVAEDLQSRIAFVHRRAADREEAVLVQLQEAVEQADSKWRGE